LAGGYIDPGHGDDGAYTDSAGFDRRLRGGGILHSAIVRTDACHHPDHGWDEDQHHPGTEGELGDADDNRDDAGSDHADSVDAQTEAPAAGLGLELPPVADHARLAEGEGDEHADGVERDQVGDT